jgi:predicted small lipoprotein YifL
MRKAILLLLAACVVAALAPGCGSSGGAETPPPASPAVPGTTTPQPDPSAAEQSLRAEVHAYAARMMADIKAAEQRGDMVDGVPVGQSDNPYDYVGISPVFTRLVALGKPAVPAIVAEIEASDHDGLREYLLAAAGAQISGDTPGDGQSWSTGKEWASRFRLDE